MFNFLYDGSKRLTSYKSTDNKVGINFTYDGNGNLIKWKIMKMISKIFIHTPILIIHLFQGHLSAGKEPLANQAILIEDDLLTYTIANNLVTKIHLQFKLSGDAADFDLAYNNDNLSKVSRVKTGYTASFGYGSKKPVFPVVSKFILDQAGFSLQFVAKNELLSMVFDFPGTQFDKAITTQYTYNAGGYVLTSNDGRAQISCEYE